jgi:hypothetical protein
MDLIEVDQRRRVTLPKTAHHDRYAVSTSPDGTITLTPVIVRSVLEDALRQRPGYMEKLERDAADPSNAIHFADWENPTT